MRDVSVIAALLNAYRYLRKLLVKKKRADSCESPHAQRNNIEQRVTNFIQPENSDINRQSQANRHDESIVPIYRSLFERRFAPHQ